MTIDLAKLHARLLVGSQHLYGPETLQQVDADARAVADGLNADAGLPVRLDVQPVLTTPDAVSRALADADHDDNCLGVVCWMHTFSPAKMWVHGLSRFAKPLCHLHTQFHRDIPWSTLDMDYMNLHQSAHGGREFGHVCTRLKLNRSVVVGHWKDPAVHRRLGTWQRAAAAIHDGRRLKVARLGDNMRQVAVTEGDKVEAQLKLGYAVHGYGLGDLAPHLASIEDKAVVTLCETYLELYNVADALRPGNARHDELKDAARIELALRSFLEGGGFHAFTDTFENLTGLNQLPGIAAQRLMADGYGFAAEGDWKHAALVRALKVMAHGSDGGTSFMEDYTYHFGDPAAGSAAGEGGYVLGAHMLEICPSIAGDTPRCEIHPLGIGGKADPVRLVFTAAAGPAVNASLVDLGDRFRLVLNPVTVIDPPHDLPKLPVARALWKPHPDLPHAAAAWIEAGGAHHTAFSQAVDVDTVQTYGHLLGLETVTIG